MVWRSQGPAVEHHMGQERKQITDALASMARPAKPSEVADLVGKRAATVRQMMLRMANQGLLRQLVGGLYQVMQGEKNKKY